MPYGSIKVDNIVFDNGGVDQSTAASGIYRAITSGVTVTGTISGATIQGTTVSGTTLNGVTISGTTVTGGIATFVSGVFTTQISGATVTGTTAQFTNITGVGIGATTITGTTVTGTTANFVSGVFTTQISGTTVTGTTASFTTGTFTSLTGITTSITSGIFAAGSVTAPSVSIGVGTTYKPGIYSPATDQLAITISGNNQVFINADGQIGIGINTPDSTVDITGIDIPLSVKSTTSGFNAIRHNHYSAGVLAYIGAGDALLPVTGTSYDYAIRANTGNLLFSAGGSNEYARLDTSGRFLVNTSTNSGGAIFQVNGDRIRVGIEKTPASASATGTAGEICWDANYIYVCTATNTWKRVAIATW